MEAHSKRVGGRGGHAAELWLLSKGSVASSEQTKYWSQLNITFPFVHKPSEMWWMQRGGEGCVWRGRSHPTPDLQEATWSSVRRSDLLPCLIISQVFFQHCHLFYKYLSIVPDEHRFFSPVLVSIMHYKHRRLPLPFISSLLFSATGHPFLSLHYFIWICFFFSQPAQTQSFENELPLLLMDINNLQRSQCGRRMEIKHR